MKSKNLRKMRVREVMQGEPRTVSADATLLEAVGLMHKLNVSSLVIEPADDSDAFAIVTRRDILNSMVLGAHEDLSFLIEDIMTKPAITVGPALSVDNCLLLMRTTGTRRLPVVDGGKLIGMISNTDIFIKLAEECG